MEALGIYIAVETLRNLHTTAKMAEKVRGRAEHAAEAAMRSEGCTLTGGWIKERHRRAEKEILEHLRACNEFEFLWQEAREFVPLQLLKELQWQLYTP